MGRMQRSCLALHVTVRSYGLTNIVMVLMVVCVRHPPPRSNYLCGPLEVVGSGALHPLHIIMVGIRR